MKNDISVNSRRAPAWRRLRRDRGGATAVEMAVVLLAVIMFTFGIMEFGIALWDYNRAEKATQIGARAAAVGSPVASDILTNEGKTASNSYGASGPPCSTGGDGFVGCDAIVCSASDSAGATVSCTNYGGTTDAAAFQRILTAVRNYFPNVTGTNMIVEYEPISNDGTNSVLGFVGRPSGAIVPMVTVRLTGLNYNFILINAFLGSNTIPMPGFNATLTAEDLNTAGVS